MSDEMMKIAPDAEGFVEKVTPKEPGDGVFFFKCKKCDGVHFRHAGYIKAMMPFMRAGNEKKISIDDLAVSVCVACRSAFVWLNEQMYEVTDQIDMKAWSKFEKEAHRATGPGGQC